MNGVDYTRRLAKEREYFKDSLKKNNEAHKQRLDETETRHNHVEKKLSENYQKDRADLEKSYQGNVNVLKEKNSEAMNSQTDKFNKDMAVEREQFAKDSVVKSKDFDQRLRDIKHSYNRAFKAESENDEKIRNAQEKRYGKNVEDLVVKQDKQLKKYQSEMAGAGADIKDQFKREKQQLVRNQEEVIKGMNERHYDERELVKNRFSNELAKTKEVHEDEQEQLRDYTSDKVVRTEKFHTNRAQKTASDYSDRYEKDAKKQHKENLKTNQQYEDQYSKVRREAQNKIRESENLARRRDNGENEFKDVLSSNRDLNGKGIQEHKMKNMKAALEDTKHTYEEMAAKDSDDHKVSMERERAENRAFMDKTTNKLKAANMVTIAEERTENQERLDHQERQDLVKTQDLQGQIAAERKQGEVRNKNLKENFHKSMTELEEKLRANIDDVTLSANADKKDFVKRTSEQTIQQLADMKSEYNRQLDQTVQGYEFRLMNMQKDFDELKMSANQKIAAQSQQSEVELDHERKTGAERRDAEVRGLKSAIDELEHRHRMETNGHMVNYQKQIAKMQAQSDLKLKLITNDYESKLKEANASKSRDIAEKDNYNRAELERLKLNYADDKQRTTAGYEAKLQQLKDHHETQMQQLNDFKKLS